MNILIRILVLYQVVVLAKDTDNLSGLSGSASDDAKLLERLRDRYN